MECLSLRVKDLDFDRNTIVVRHGKGAKDRVVMLPAPLTEPLRTQLACSRSVWAADRCGIPLRHICSTQAWTFAAYRSCWVTAT